MKERSFPHMVLILMTIALVAVACGGAEQAGGPAAGEPAATDDTAAAPEEPVTIDFLQPLPKSIAFYPLFVSERLGYFEEEGVAVNLLPSGDIPATVVVPSGNADIGATTPANIVVGAASGEDFAIVYEYYQKNVFSIITPEGSGITDITGLEGGNIGITSEGAGDAAFTRAALTLAGLDPESDVTITVVGEGGPIVARALESGQIDAFAGAINDLVALRVAGINYVDISPEELQILPASSMIMTPQKMDELAEPIGGFLRAWAKGTYVGMVRPDVVLAMAKEEVPEETGDEEFGQALLDVSVELQTPVEGDDNFGALRLDAWDAVQDQLIEGGELEEVIDSSSFLDDRFIDDANDWDRAEVESEANAWADENL